MVVTAAKATATFGKCRSHQGGLRNGMRAMARSMAANGKIMPGCGSTGRAAAKISESGERIMVCEPSSIREERTLHRYHQLSDGGPTIGLTSEVSATPDPCEHLTPR